MKTQVQTAMKNIKSILIEQTKELKLEYVSSTVTWAEKEFNKIIEMSKWSEKKWCEYFGIESEVQNKGSKLEFVGFPRGFYSTKNSKTLIQFRDKARKYQRVGIDSFKDQWEKLAVDHYNNSIDKLVHRISQKGLNESSLVVETARVKQNIETTITDGSKTVRAYTIMAWGEIQRPHYRYLIK